MAHFTLPVAQNKYAALKMLVGLHERALRDLTTKGQPAPQPILLDAIIDTGATATCVPHGALAPLGIAPTNVVKFETASDDGVPCSIFPVGVVLHNGVRAWNGEVAELPASCKQQHALIGCDILSSCVLIYNGAIGAFSLCL